MGARKIFSRGGQIRGSGNESPPAESRVEPRWRSGGEGQVVSAEQEVTLLRNLLLGGEECEWLS